MDCHCAADAAIACIERRAGVPALPRTEGKSSKRGAGSCFRPFGGCCEKVSDAANRANEVIGTEEPAEFLTQPADVYIHAAVEGIQRTAERHFRNLVARHNIAGIAKQQLQDVELNRSQINGLSS